MPTFAVVIPIGPGARDPARARAALASLLVWEPLVSVCVLVEDRETPSGLAESAVFSTSCDVVALQNPRNGRGYGHTGGLCAGILTALGWIQQNAAVDFVLKLDTDALVINPFAAKLCDLLTHEAGIGIGLIGTVGPSCNPELRPSQDPRREPDLLRLRRLLPRAAPEPADGAFDDGGRIRIDGLGLIAIELLRSFCAIRPHVDRAVANGFDNSEYCQGGAYVVSREMLDRMAGLGYLTRPEPWIWLPVGEDMGMAMYARAAGLTLRDASGPDEPFGIQAGGLAYDPNTMVERGYSVVHSTRNDPLHSETDILRFFYLRAVESARAFTSADSDITKGA